MERTERMGRTGRMVGSAVENEVGNEVESAGRTGRMGRMGRMGGSEEESVVGNEEGSGEGSEAGSVGRMVENVGGSEEESEEKMEEA